MQKRRGRPTMLNRELVHSICSVVEIEMISLKIVCQRFDIKEDTMALWISTGRNAMQRLFSAMTDYEKNCRYLVLGLETIHEAQKQKLAENIKEPSHAETARLVLSLSPGLEFIESVNRV